MRWSFITVGVIAYAGIYQAHGIVATWVANYDETLIATTTAKLVTDGVAIANWLVPGYLIGRLVANRGIAHGSIVGALGSLCSIALFWYAFKEFESPRDITVVESAYAMAKTALLCGLAGGVGELHGTREFRA